MKDKPSKVRIKFESEEMDTFYKGDTYCLTKDKINSDNLNDSLASDIKLDNESIELKTTRPKSKSRLRRR